MKIARRFNAGKTVQKPKSRKAGRGDRIQTAQSFLRNLRIQAPIPALKRPGYCQKFLRNSSSSTQNCSALVPRAQLRWVASLFWDSIGITARASRASLRSRCFSEQAQCLPDHSTSASPAECPPNPAAETTAPIPCAPFTQELSLMGRSVAIPDMKMPIRKNRKIHDGEPADRADGYQTD